MNIIISLLLLLLAWLGSGCKSIDLSGSHQEEELYYQELFGLIATPDGGYLLGATRYHSIATVTTTTDLLNLTYQYDPASTYADLTVIKTDASGNRQWEKALEKPEFQTGAKLVLLPGGNYLLAGNVRNKALTLQDVILSELGPDGAEQSSRQLAKPGTGLSLNDLKIGTTGDLFLAGYQSKAGDLTKKQADLITRLSPDGLSTRWTLSSTDSTTLLAEGSIFDFTDDGSLLIASRKPVNSLSQAYFRKISPDGIVRWTQFASGVNELRPRQLYATADGGFLLAGSALTQGQSQIVLLKVDANGNTQSVQWFDTGSFSYDNRSEILMKRADGRFVLATWKPDGLLSLTLLDTNGGSPKSIPTTTKLLKLLNMPVMLALANGDILLAELINQNSSQTKVIMLRRIGADGKEIWQRTIASL